MSGCEIIDFPAPRDRRSGNGAREALIAVALTLPNETTQHEAEMWADWVLAELWASGFKAVPLE